LNNFIGQYLNLAGYTVGNFKVESLAGRTGTGSPRWKLRCTSCGDYQTLDHATLMPLIQGRQSQMSLQCTGSCPLSRTVRVSESLFDIRRQERMEAKAAEEQAAQVAKASAEAKAVKRAADAGRLALQREYIRYWNHQIKNTETNESEIASLKRWTELTNDTRSRIMEIIGKDATVRVTGLV
jgi:hypothetical protein